MAASIRRSLLWLVPLSLILGAVLSSIQGGAWLPGWIAFSFLCVVLITALVMTTKWAGGGRLLLWMVALAFALRLTTGVGAYLLLPIDGHPEEVNQAGFIFKDAYQRDGQAWELASSDLPIVDALNRTYAYDQYGGLLAFSALIYRTLSPDMHRTLLLVLVTAGAASIGIPFLWKAVSQQWGIKVAQLSGWILVLYPESLLLGGSAMREPYLMTFSAIALWGFVSWLATHNVKPTKRKKNTANRSPMVWLSVAVGGMLLVSPAVALMTIVIFGGWLYFSAENHRVPWWAVAVTAAVFIAGLFLFSEAIDPRGDFSAATPLGVVVNWFRRALLWDLNQLVDESGWVQKIFDAIPEWLRLPFVASYGILQPVLPAAIAAPTTATWKIITIVRAAGWYILLPLLLFSFIAASGAPDRERRVWLWLTACCWFWILLAAVRAGGDQWDNPRYRSILLLWQSLIGAQAFLFWQQKRVLSFWQIIAGEVVFLLVFTQWYISRYSSAGGRLEFGEMVALIAGLWALIAAAGFFRQFGLRSRLRQS
jgi:hypothetical protein